MEKSSILKTFGKYVSLNIFGMIGLSCYILADTFFIARGVGTDGLTALNLAIPVYSFIHGLGLMIGIGGATRYAIAKGCGDDLNYRNIFTQGFYFMLIIASGFLLIGLFFSNPLSVLLGASGTVLTMTNTYLKVLLIFAPMFMCNNLLICFVRNDGNPRLSMTAMLIGSFSNIVLDYVFIYPLGMGMFGAAFATGIAPIVSMLILSRHFIRRKSHFRLYKMKPALKSLFDISSLGASALIVEVSSGIVMIVFNTLLLRISGNIGVAAYGVIANIALVLISIFTGISQGIQPIISRRFGEGKKGDIRKVYHYALITALVFAVASYVFSFLFAEPIVELFNKEHNKELASIAISGLKIYFIAFLFIGINIVTAAYLSSVARPRHAFAISLLRGFVLVIPMAFLLSTLFGVTGIWLTLPVSECLVSVAVLLIIRRFHKTF